MKTLNRTIRRSSGEKIFDIFNVCFMVLMMIICIYPFWYVICASFSKASLLMGHPGILFRPLGFTTEAYRKVFSNSRIWIGYANTIFYVIAGTLINLVTTVLGAYFLSRKDVPGQKTITVLIMFTMYFSGGLIPQFLNIQQLGLYDTRWAILLPGAVSTFNLIIMRTSMASIDSSLEESCPTGRGKSFYDPDTDYGTSDETNHGSTCAVLRCRTLEFLVQCHDLSG